MSGETVELDWAIDQITVGARHRKDLGDIHALAASIAQFGLLQPVTITRAGVLVCGARRLAAMRALGWKKTPVWVCGGLSEALAGLMAERDENAFHKPYSLTEQATLYEELKTEMAADAARRQAATRFRPATRNPSPDGGVKMTPPPAGRTREQAAVMVTGAKSQNTLERVNHLRHIANDPTIPAGLRDQAAAHLDAIDAGAAVHPAWAEIQAEMTLRKIQELAEDATQPRTVRQTAGAALRHLRQRQTRISPIELDQAATAALERVAASSKARKPATRPQPAPALGPDGPHAPGPAPLPGRVPERWTRRAFTATWAEASDWTEHWDPDQIGPALSDAEWEMFTTAVARTVAFHDAARRARLAARAVA